MSVDLWLTFIAATAAMMLIPGPTVMLVLSYALSNGRSVAVASAAGVAFGYLIAMTASLAGLGALALASATAFNALKWIGAAYLVYLGIKLILSAKTADGLEISEATDITASRVFRHTAAVTALNPKSIAFFIAFVPQFVRADAPLAPQFLILITSFVTLGGLNALTYALLADRLRTIIKRPNVITWITRVGGGALITMGVLTAPLRRSTT